MTVQAAAAPVADVDLGAATQQFTEIYAQYWGRIRRFIWTRLDWHQQDLAEDIANETFIEFWQSFVLTGKLDSVETVFGLLCTMSRHQIAQYFRRQYSGERVLDVTDPVNTPIVATGHSYAAERPDVAPMVAELDAAMETMRERSERWQKLHGETYRLRCMLDGTAEPARSKLAARIDGMDQDEETALSDFRAACLHVGQLRGEIQTAAGGSWQASVDIPLAIPHTVSAERSHRTDPTITHCLNGHLVDYANTRFKADGTRLCRTCQSEYQARRTDERRTAARARRERQALKAAAR